MLANPALVNREEIEWEQLSHHIKANCAYEELIEDIEKARAVDSYKVISVDLQKVNKIKNIKIIIIYFINNIILFRFSLAQSFLQRNNIISQNFIATIWQ